MKKIILATIFALAATAASAQLNVRAGYAASTWHNGADVGSTYAGASIGVGYDVALNKSFALAPSLRYTFAWREKQMPSPFVRSKTTEQALALPVHVKFSLPLGDDFRVYFLAGPGVGYGLGYKVKETYTRDPNIPEGSMGVINNEGYVTSDFYTGKASGIINNPALIEKAEADGLHLKRMDIFASFGAGVRWRGVFLEAGYDVGLLNRSKRDDAWRHDQFNVAVGYNF